MMIKKKTTFANFTNAGRRAGIRQSKKTRQKYNDGLTTQERKLEIIKKASNGCWWVETYLRKAYD